MKKLLLTVAAVAAMAMTLTSCGGASNTYSFDGKSEAIESAFFSSKDIFGHDLAGYMLLFSSEKVDLEMIASSTSATFVNVNVSNSLVGKTIDLVNPELAATTDNYTVVFHFEGAEYMFSAFGGEQVTNTPPAGLENGTMTVTAGEAGEFTVAIEATIEGKALKLDYKGTMTDVNAAIGEQLGDTVDAVIEENIEGAEVIDGAVIEGAEGTEVGETIVEGVAAPVAE